MHSAAVQLGHHDVPGQRDGVLLTLGRVVLSDGVQEELLGVGFGVLLLVSGESDGADLGHGDDDDEESVSGQQHSGLFDGSAVAQERDDEDEGAGRDQDVGALLDHRRLRQFLHISIRISCHSNY